MIRWNSRKVILSVIAGLLGVLKALGVDLDMDGIMVALIGAGMFVGVEGLRDIVVALRPPASPPGVPQLPYTELDKDALMAIGSRVAEELARRAHLPHN
jgi:hypothetical protein